MLSDQKYLDFDIWVAERTSGLYPVTLIDSPAGQASTKMDIPYAEWEEMLATVAGARGGPETDPLVLTEQRYARDLGDRMFQCLISGTIRDRYQASLQKAKDKKKGLRIRLRLQAPELASLPWEYLLDISQRPLRPMTLSRETPVIRFLEMPVAAGRLRLKPPVRVLGMVGYRKNLSVKAEMEAIEKAVEHLTSRGNGMMSLEWIEGHTRRDLEAALRRADYHVFHFIGHGDFDEAQGKGCVLFEAEGGANDSDLQDPHLRTASKPDRVSADVLGEMLSGQTSLRVVILNSCKGATASQTNLFSSTGAILAEYGIAGVISMQNEITNKAANEFSRTFYDCLTLGAPLEAAVAEARQSIRQTMPGTLEWGTPVLHLRADDGLLFRIDVRSAVLPAASESAASESAASEAAASEAAASESRKEPTSASAPASPASSPRFAATPSRETDRSELRNLATKVKEYWIDSVLHQKLDHSVRLELRMDRFADARATSYRMGEDSESLSGMTTGELYAEEGSLLILGEPGCGKTVTLLELARDLLKSAEADETHRIPVVFNLSSWAKKKNPLLAEWMVEELRDIFDVPKRLGSAWVEDRKCILPLLDGLDEVAEASRAACVDAINAWKSKPYSHVVVCCRFAEYNALPDLKRLRVNSVVCLQTLLREQVLDFVEQAGPRLAALRTLLERDSGMLNDARTPLMLNMMVEAYKEKAGDVAVADQDLAGRRMQVVGDFVAARFQTRGGGARG